MNLINDVRVKALSGLPYIFDDVCAIYPAKLKEIAAMGLPHFLELLGCLQLRRPLAAAKDPNLKELLAQITDFQFFLAQTSNADARKMAVEAFQFFTHEPVIFLPDQLEIAIGPINERHIINEENFSRFQSLVKNLHILDHGDDIVFKKDDTDRVRELKEKFLKSQEVINRTKKGEDSKIDFIDLVASLPISGIGLNIENIWNITYYAFQDQLTRFGWKEQYDMNVRAAMAGAKIDKEKMKSWIRSMSSDK